MITKEEQGKIFCKGRGLHCPSCLDRYECVDSTANTNKLNPIEVVEQLRKEGKGLMVTFGDEYIAYLEVLNAQVFEPNGYRLIAEKVEEV